MGDYAQSVSKGLDALILTLPSLDIGPGDDLLDPSNTYIANWLAVTAVGPRSVPVEKYNADLSNRSRVLIKYGSRKNYVNKLQGVNSRLDSIQANVLRATLPDFDAWTDRRRPISTVYSEGLLESRRLLPHVLNRENSTWHRYVVRSPDRDRLKQILAKVGMRTMNQRTLLSHTRVAYARLVPGALPLAYKMKNEEIILPMGPHLKSADAAKVVIAVNAVTV
ncbi:DegT/DnrJ/EryC1/StrS family aminotransferase [Aliiroseovarius sp. S1123]|uniref:DegT/DnrJ/EryC1/StrS family aminotransferase n=1 Tax=Aliiroseovarius sp. S1123 TaxID=2926404 RepID=UPI001FF294D3|nr:DegT/DnrJ/EryC1/StrS family aminotransferase [Aliiroseovarius sp. S1123]